MIGLLIEKQVTYTDVEADALIAQVKKLAKESGRTVRAEAELLLSRDRESRLRDLRNKMVGASELLAAITVEVDDLRAESGDDDGELAAIMADDGRLLWAFHQSPNGWFNSDDKAWGATGVIGCNRRAEADRWCRGSPCLSRLDVRRLPGSVAEPGKR